MRLIDAEFEENHYASMLLDPTPDVTEQDKHKAKIIINALRMAKTVEPKKGHWIVYVVSPFDGEDVMCSECGQRGCAPYWDFCPHCGARMEDSEDETD